MVGIKIGAWSDLPIEAVCVWIAVSYTTAIVFEVAKLWQASGRPAKHAFCCLNLCGFASLADVAKGGDGAKSALREIFLRVHSRSLFAAI